MAFENIKAGVALLAGEMVDAPEDRHEALEQVREKLNELRAMGMPLPEDLVALEAELEAEEPAAAVGGEPLADDLPPAA